MSVQEQINRIETNIANTYTAAAAKGATIPTTQNSDNLASTIASIPGGGAPVADWTPNPNWPNIKDVLRDDTREYAGKVAYLMYNYNETSVFNLVDAATASGTQPTAVATSDGAFYSFADNGASVTHTWDTSKDFPVNGQAGYYLATRWVVLYFGTDTVTSLFNDVTYGLGYSNSATDGNAMLWVVYKCNVESNEAKMLMNMFWLEAVELYDYDNYTFAGTRFDNFCQYGYSLRKLPDVMDVSQSTLFYQFCSYCGALPKLPSVFRSSQGTDFRNFCANCSSLQKLPDVFDISQGKQFNSFLDKTFSLIEMPSAMDFSKGTTFNYAFRESKALVSTSPELVIDLSSASTRPSSASYAPFYNASKLRDIKVKLYNGNAWFSSSNALSVESFRFMADNAPTVTTARTLTVGSTNLSRIRAADPDIITTLNNKNWTVA